MSRPATREQLLDVRRQTQLVLYGKGLLEKKRDSLLRALEEERRCFREREAALKEHIAALWQIYGRLYLLEGATVSALLRPVLPRRVLTRLEMVMGCRFPVFTPHPETPFGPPSYDPALTALDADALVEKLGQIDDLLWTYLNAKAKVQALERELSRTLARINVLEHTLLPEFREDEVRIRNTLSERERQERFALKKLTRGKNKNALP
ncbi:MAG: V-type ATP synthase subunit D [Synergistaceae bacterium]|jgi:V/A-type H+-transporting ATPase subunit D|nr:V-type ATP synthase subunit D [Synergistaceae bacterium]